VLIALAAARGAEAQPVPSARPYRGLFGGSEGGPERGQSLDLNWSLLGAYDDNVTADTGSPIEASTQVQGSFGTAAASLNYTARGERQQFSAAVRTGGRYYPDLRELSAMDAAASANFTAALARNVTFQASQAIGYQPYYQFAFLTNLVPSDPEVTRTSDGAIRRLRSYDADGHAQLEMRFGGRSSVLAEYGYRRTTFGGDGRFLWQAAGARFTRNLTRNLGLRLGYGYGEARNSLGTIGPRIASHTLDAGVGYSRSLSFSRLTTLNFGTGTTIVRYNHESQLTLTGNVGLTREIGRSWRAGADFARGVQFVAGFDDPVIANTLNVHLRGLLARRVEAVLSGGYAAGTIGLNQSGRGYSTYSGSAGLRFAFSRLLSLETQYFYYRYDFDQLSALPLGVARTLNRQGFRCGISGWLPLYR
jgi:hypothetical protein